MEIYIGWSLNYFEEYIADIAFKPVLLQSTRHPFANMDVALSREVNRKGKRKRTIYCDVDGCTQHDNFLFEQL